MIFPEPPELLKARKAVSVSGAKKRFYYKLENKIERYVKFHGVNPDEQAGNIICEKAVKEILATLSEDVGKAFLADIGARAE